MSDWPLHPATLERDPDQPGTQRWPIRHQCLPKHGRRLVTRGVRHRRAATRNASPRTAPDRLDRVWPATATAAAAVTA
jgi:hypothetical protein